jgi:hypothetical protein
MVRPLSLIERLRHLTTPHESRWQPMLGGLALFAAGAGAAVLLEVSDFLAAIMTGLALAAWAMGACALIGYVRWMFAAEVKRTKDDSP